MSGQTIRFAYADTCYGQLHYAEVGDGPPVLLLHQTPRSWDEFREVLPLLAKNRRVIAMDMYGFGMSAKPPSGTTQRIEQFAQGAVALMDALGVIEFAVLGHHTGMFVASEIASMVPDRVTAAVFSAGEFADAGFRESLTMEMTGKGGAPISPSGGVDVATIQEDGSHLMVLWAKRYPLYPPDRPDLLNRYIHDALAAGVDPAEGHRACARYRMEDRVGLVTAPILVLANTADPVSYPHTERVAGAYVNAASVEVVEIDGGTIPVMEHKSAQVAETVVAFFEKVGI